MMPVDLSTIRYHPLPPGFTHRDYISQGNYGRVYLDFATQTVVKFSNDYDANDQAALDVERTIYERLQAAGGHPGILQYFGPYHSGIRLEYAVKRNLIAYIRDYPETDVVQRIQWASEVASALDFIHAHSILHGDLCLNNIFLTSELVAKLADFGGSSIDGSNLLAYVTQSHELPGPLPSVQADLFALGSTLFEIITGRRPYHDLTDGEIERRYKNREFPDIVHLGYMGQIILKCWHSRYESAADVMKDIQSI